MHDFLIISYCSFPAEPPNLRGPKLRRRLPKPPIEARRHLRSNGWTYKTAAPAHDCCWQHLALVLPARN